MISKLDGGCFEELSNKGDFLFDFKLALIRIHLNHIVAFQTSTKLPNEDIAMMSVHLTFGRALGPYKEWFWRQFATWKTMEW